MVDRLSRSLPPACEALVVSGIHDGPNNGEAEGIRYYRTLDWWDRCSFSVMAGIYSIIPGLAGGHAFRSFLHRGYVRRASHYLQSNGVGSVIFPHYPQWAVPLRAVMPDAKLVLWVLNEWLCFAPERLAACLKKVDRVVCSSRFIADKVIARYPWLEERVRVIPYGVDTARFTPSAKQLRHVILYAGRLAPERGIHILLRAFEQVREHYPDALLVVAGNVQLMPASLLSNLGDKKEVQGWKRLGARYESLLRRETQRQEGVFLPGRVDQSSMLKLYRTATVFVFPSLWNEPFGNVLPEAMACGLPIVATQSGGIPEVIEDNRSGMLKERGDADALAEAIGRIFDNRDLAARMGSAARTRAEEMFDWKHVAEMMVDAISD